MSDVKVTAVSSSKPKTFVHPGKKVFILIPNDDTEARKASAALEEPFSEIEHLPTVTQALRIGMLNDQNVVYVAHVSKKRGKLPDGRFGLTEVFNVSAPIYCEKFAKVSLDDGLAIVDVPALADAIQAATGTPELIARLSADKDMTKRTLKLFGT